MKKLILTTVMCIMLGAIHAQTLKTSVFPAGGGASENEGYKHFGTFGQPLSVGSAGNEFINREGFVYAQQNCLSVAVSHSKTICYNDNPGTFTSTVTAAEGAVLYQWQEWKDNAWHNIAGAETEIYEPGNLIQTTDFRLLADDPAGCGQAGSATITITVHDQLQAGSFTDGDDRHICYGETTLPLTVTPPAGGSGIFLYQWQFFNRTVWQDVDAGSGSNTLSYSPPVLYETTSYRLLQTDTYCAPPQTTGTASVTIAVEPLPVSGKLTKTPPGELVLTGVPVSAVLTPGSGGNETDLLQYRTFVGAVSSTWQPYTSATPIPTNGDITRVEIRTQRQTDVCDVPDMITVFWDFDETPVTNATQNFYYYTIQDAIDNAGTGDLINIASGTYAENVTTQNGNNVRFSPGFSEGMVTVTGTFTLKSNDVIEIEIFDDNRFDRFVILDEAAINDATLEVIMVNGYNPPTGTRYTFFTSPNYPGKFSNPPLFKTSNTHFVITNNYNEVEEKWELTLNSVTPVFKMEIKTIGQ